mmetsp:Transcript_55920/g.179479  ORF Transcript_55920/g.179479 Transcript_55920/m.179479 type:complete len:261 (+) Transcript_55920:99-881(+)
MARNSPWCHKGATINNSPWDVECRCQPLKRILGPVVWVAAIFLLAIHRVAMVVAHGACELCKGVRELVVQVHMQGAFHREAHVHAAGQWAQSDALHHIEHGEPVPGWPVPASPIPLIAHGLALCESRGCVGPPVVAVAHEEAILGVDVHDGPAHDAGLELRPLHEVCVAREVAGSALDHGGLVGQAADGAPVRVPADGDGLAGRRAARPGLVAVEGRAAESGRGVAVVDARWRALAAARRPVRQQLPLAQEDARRGLEER